MNTLNVTVTVMRTIKGVIDSVEGALTLLELTCSTDKVSEHKNREEYRFH